MKIVVIGGSGLSGSIAAFSRDISTGQLNYVQTLSGTAIGLTANRPGDSASWTGGGARGLAGSRRSPLSNGMVVTRKRSGNPRVAAPFKPAKKTTSSWRLQPSAWSRRSA